MYLSLKVWRLHEEARRPLEVLEDALVSYASSAGSTSSDDGVCSTSIQPTKDGSLCSIARFNIEDGALLYSVHRDEPPVSYLRQLSATAAMIITSSALRPRWL